MAFSDAQLAKLMRQVTANTKPKTQNAIPTVVLHVLSKLKRSISRCMQPSRALSETLSCSLSLIKKQEQYVQLSSTLPILLEYSTSRLLLSFHDFLVRANEQ
jgi:hypothetical protein